MLTNNVNIVFNYNVQMFIYLTTVVPVVKEFLVSKNPQFDYSKFCLHGFIKTFPFLSEADPEVVALRIYEDASAFSGRYGRSLAGGGEDDIRNLVAAAAGVEVEVYVAREIKDSLCMKLRRAWLNNDHVFIFTKARDFERSASMAIVDLRSVDWADPNLISEEDEEEGIEISEVVEEWIETLCAPSQSRSVNGNYSHKKLRRKPAPRAVKSLFEGI